MHAHLYTLAALLVCGNTAVQPDLIGFLSAEGLEFIKNTTVRFSRFSLVHNEEIKQWISGIILGDPNGANARNVTITALSIAENVCRIRLSPYMIGVDVYVPQLGVQMIYRLSNKTKYESMNLSHAEVWLRCNVSVTNDNLLPRITSKPACILRVGPPSYAGSTGQITWVPKLTPFKKLIEDEVVSKLFQPIVEGMIWEKDAMLKDLQNNLTSFNISLVNNVTVHFQQAGERSGNWSDFRVPISLVLKRNGVDVTANSTFDPHNICPKSPDLCSQVKETLYEINEDLKNKTGYDSNLRGDHHMFFFFDLLKHPKLSKPATGKAFAEFIIAGKWSHANDYDKVVEGAVGAAIEDAELDGKFANEDIVFEVTDYFLNSLVQSLIDSGITTNVDVNPTQIDEKKTGDWNGTIEYLNVSDAWLAQLDEYGKMFRTKCPADGEFCIGKSFRGFSEKYPDDTFAMDVNVKPDPFNVTETGLEGKVDVVFIFRLAKAKKHLIDVSMTATLGLADASIANGTVFVNADFINQPVFSVANDESEGLLKKAGIWQSFYNAKLEMIGAKLGEWRTVGNPVPEMPFVRVVDARMTTLDGRIYFIVSKAEIAKAKE